MNKKNKKTTQQQLLRDARDTLGIDSTVLAEMLGVTLPTLRSWILPKTSKAHRGMPLTAKLLLDRILSDRKHQ